MAKIMTDDRDFVVLVDVGGLGGIPQEWEAVHDRLTPVVFEPNPAEAAPLRGKISRYGNGQGLVIQKGLAAVSGSRTLSITKSVACSTTLTPNDEFLAGYSISEAFKVTAVEIVECSRYDTLFHNGEVPRPDVVKVDVQGLEYEVLLGFGELLSDCLGVQLESQFYPIYRDQKLFGDVIDLLSRFGLVLRKVAPSHHFDGDLVELDAWFTVDKARESKLDSVRREKMDLIHRVWGLAEREVVFGPDFFQK
ncbi:FkbM family methyltransferase [Acidisoma sp.]|uniref:FkbM family methyltransferase n=1 Tax=Acidisoma sp. TaxID=1872115 RepID=UPI003AFFA61D